MALRILASSRKKIWSSASYASVELYYTRGFASTSRVSKEAISTASPSNVQGEHVPSADKGKKASSSSPTVPSSCPPGTILSGLSLYKDRADPVALPDSEYPDWLWTILEDPSAQLSHAGVILETTAGLSKGEARVVQKRNLRAVRSAQRGREAKELANGSAGAGMKAVGVPSEGVVAAPAGEAERLQGDVAMTVKLASTRSIEAEIEARKALRKANREKIKARNFLSKR